MSAPLEGPICTNAHSLKMPKLAKARVTVCAVKVYTDAFTTTPLTTFTKSSIALRILLCLYSRYVINCLRKVSETTSAPILWIGSLPRGSARRPPPLVRAEEVSAWSKARYDRCLNQQKDTSFWCFQHVRVASTCGVAQKRSQREAPLRAVTFSLGQTKSTSQNLAPKGKVIDSPHNTCEADKL